MVAETEPMVPPRRRTMQRGELAVVGFAAGIGLAEACIAYWSVSVGALLHGALVLALVNAVAFSGGDRREGGPNWAYAAAALTLVPLLRLLALSMPGDASSAIRLAVAGIPVLGAAALAVAGPFRAIAPLLSRWTWREQLPIGVAGIPLGLLAFAIVQPDDAIVERHTWANVVLAAAALLVFAGLTEELIFRGIVQEGLTHVLGRRGPAAAALLFGCTYLAVGQIAYAGYVTIVGFGFGWLVRSTGSLLGVSIAHGLMSVGLLLVWPLVLG